MVLPLANSNSLWWPNTVFTPIHAQTKTNSNIIAFSLCVCARQISTWVEQRVWHGQGPNLRKFQTIRFNRKIEWNKQTSWPEFYVCLQVKTNRQKLNCKMKCTQNGVRSPGTRSSFRGPGALCPLRPKGTSVFLRVGNFVRVANIGLSLSLSPSRWSQKFLALIRTWRIYIWKMKRVSFVAIYLRASLLASGPTVAASCTDARSRQSENLIIVLLDAKKSFVK